MRSRNGRYWGSVRAFQLFSSTPMNGLETSFANCPGQSAGLPRSQTHHPLHACRRASVGRISRQVPRRRATCNLRGFVAAPLPIIGGASHKARSKRSGKTPKLHCGSGQEGATQAHASADTRAGTLAGAA